MIKIIVKDGSAIRTANVEAANIDTHIAARDKFKNEAMILREYTESETERDPIAYKYADPLEGGRFVYNEIDLAEIEREDENLIERIKVIY